MIFKIVLLFLAFIAVLGMLGKLHWIGGNRLRQTTCLGCGKKRLRRGPCDCGKGGA